MVRRHGNGEKTFDPILESGRILIQSFQSIELFKTMIRSLLIKRVLQGRRLTSSHAFLRERTINMGFGSRNPCVLLNLLGAANYRASENRPTITVVMAGLGISAMAPSSKLSRALPAVRVISLKTMDIKTKIRRSSTDVRCGQPMGIARISAKPAYIGKPVKTKASIKNGGP